mgnify:CR=1 FL=1
MPNFFQKLNPKDLIHTGVIVIPNIIEPRQYEILYENQVYDSLQYWDDFKNVFNLNYKFLNDITDLKQQNDIICLWFFPERRNKDTKRMEFFDLQINGRDIKYHSNTVLITNKQIDILENKFVLRRPCVQIDIQSANITTKKKIKQMMKRELG